MTAVRIKAALLTGSLHRPFVLSGVGFQPSPTIPQTMFRCFSVIRTPLLRYADRRPTECSVDRPICSTAKIRYGRPGISAADRNPRIPLRYESRSGAGILTPCCLQARRSCIGNCRSAGLCRESVGRSHRSQDKLASHTPMPSPAPVLCLCR